MKIAFVRTREKQLGMKMRIYGLIMTLLSLSLIRPMTYLNSQATSDQVNNLENQSIPKLSETYIQHEPISISSIQDLISQGWPGEGTPSDPFIISGLNITAEGFGISISNVNAHILINDCLFIPSIDYDTGIRLNNSANCQINNSVFINLYTGISIRYSNYSNISNSLFISNDNDVVVFNVISCNIFDSTFTSSDASIILFSSSSCHFSNNEFFNVSSIMLSLYLNNSTIENSRSIGATYGISLYTSDNVVINNITTIGTELSSIQIYLSTNSTITNCFLDTGVSIMGSSVFHWDIDFNEVYISSKPLLYCFNDNNLVINATQWGQIIIANSQNIVLNSGNMYGTTKPVQIAFSNQIEVSNVQFENALVSGVYIEFSESSSIQQCTFWNCQNGIEIYESRAITIVNNYFDNSTNALDLSSSNSLEVSHNEIMNSYYGIHGLDLTYSKIANNILRGGHYGIYGVFNNYCDYISNRISSFSEAGVFFGFTSNDFLSDNKIIENMGDGIRCNTTGKMTIKSNEFIMNQGYGLVLNDGDMHQIHGNIFDSNALGNAYSTAVNAQWDNGVDMGNHWSDYNGTGVYHIPGNGENVDRYPLALGDADITPPRIIAPAEISLIMGELTVDLIIELWDSNPMEYWVYIDGTLYSSESTRSGSIVIPLSSLNPGVHNITIVVYDEAGNVAKWTTMVSIQTHPLIIAQYSIVGVSAIVIAVACYKEIKSRQH